MAGFPRVREEYDLVVVGGGHAGLQAGVKAGLLRRSALVIDRGPKYSRSYYAPKMDNIPGFPDGVSGHALLDRQIEAVRRLGEWVTYVTPARAVGARRHDGGFTVEFDWLGQRRSVRGRGLVLAMGVVDRIPEVNGQIDPIFPWANQALVDFCLLCDGHDLAGRSVAVIGHDAFAAKTALDILDFAPTAVELLTHGVPLFSGVPPEEAAVLGKALAERHVGTFEGTMTGFDELREKRFGVRFSDGSHRSYDRGFSALGWYDMHDGLPRSLGCGFDPEGYVLTDDDGRALAAESRAPIPGLYCVGDQKTGWNQIPEAWASAERAVVHAWAEYLG